MQSYCIAAVLLDIFMIILLNFLIYIIQEWFQGMEPAFPDMVPLKPILPAIIAVNLR